MRLGYFAHWHRPHWSFNDFIMLHRGIYADWTKRLKDGKFTHLVIDLATFQNWSANPKCELMWALAHPEHFQLIVSDENIYFFRIINL